MTGRSVVEYFSEHEAYRCGYCGSTDTNYSHGTWAHLMTLEDYQDLIDRGWRRSGCYVYKPTMDQTCCPLYPIRCNALEFKISKSQKKIIKRVNRFLNTGIRPSKNEIEHADSTDTSHVVFPGEGKGGSEHALEDANVVQIEKLASSKSETKMDCVSESIIVKPSGDKSEDAGADINSPSTSHCDSKVKKITKPGQGADASKPQCKKAKLLRKERRLEKNKHRDEMCAKKVKEQPSAKSLEDLLNDISDNPAHKLEIKLVRSSPPSEEFERTLSESHAVYFKYQLDIHKDKPTKPVMKQFKRFLCGSPLQPDSMESRLPDGLGSFHQQYILDGKIIAVGVVDVLPSCISSVYLYYDPEYHFLSLGNYSALREIAFTRHLHSLEPSILHYYMGYYVHSCPKMRYKGAYDPSFLNCPETHGWYPVKEAALKLDANKYSRFAPADVVDENGDIDVNAVLVLHKRQAMTYMVYVLMNTQANDEIAVKQYAQLVGKTCAQRMMLYRA